MVSDLPLCLIFSAVIIDKAQKNSAEQRGKQILSCSLNSRTSQYRTKRYQKDDSQDNDQRRTIDETATPMVAMVSPSSVP